MKRRILSVILILVMVIFSACEKKHVDDGIFDIVCTSFPVYDWVLNIVGSDNDAVNVTLLLDNGVDMHSFQPGAREIALVSSCDLLIHVGGESDAWIEDAVKESVNEKQKNLSLLSLLGEMAKVEEETGIADDDHAHEHNDEKGEPEYDEHVWLSITNAVFLTGCLTEVIAEMDPAHEDDYVSNANAYIEKLISLDEETRERIENAENKTIIVADRFPFRYLVDEYDIDYFAAFPGCSAETEASFEVVVYMADRLDETGISYVVVTENAEKGIAETIIDNTKEKNQKIIMLNSMQTVTTADYKAGNTYYSIMKENLDKLADILQ